MSKKTKQTTQFNKQAAPYMFGAANTLQSAVNANTGNVANITAGMNNILPGLQQRIAQPSPLTQAARGYATNVLGGNYLNNNPYLDQMAAQTRGNVFDAVNAGFGRSGMAGGTGHMQSLARGMGEAELGLRYNDYGAERSRMDQMAGAAGQIDTADLAALPYYLQTAGTAAELPLVNARTLAAGMGGLLGNQTTTTQKQGLGAGLMGLIGAGLSGWASGGFA